MLQWIGQKWISRVPSRTRVSILTALTRRKVGQKQPFKMLVNKCQGSVQNVLYIYASEQKRIDDFLKTFDERVKDKFVEREVDIKTLQRMKPEQVELSISENK